MNGVLKISGVDAEKFLQGQLTAHVPDAKQKPYLLAAHCNREGRVISLFYLFLINADYYLLMPRSMVAITANALKKYAVFFKVALADVSESVCIADKNLTDINHYLTQGIPLIYPETSGKFLPHELNLHTLNAIHFEKGCYTGQEIIARMHYRGKLKTHLYSVIIENNTPPLPGADVYANEKKIVGTVVVSILEGYNKYKALIVTDEQNAASDVLFLADGARITKRD